MAARKKHLLEFGGFQLYPNERLLLLDGRQVSLTPKAFDTLLVLVESGGRLVDKDELMKAVWPDTFVEEAGLTRNISSLRKALGEAPDEARFIETVPRRGYRFIAPVTSVSEEEGSPEIGNRPSPASERTDIRNAELGSLQQPIASKALISSHRVLLVLVIAGVAIAALAYLFLTGREVDRGTAGATTIAVLPFRSLEAGADEHLGIGLADTLITQLSSIRGINVRPTSAVIKYANSEDWEAAGKALQVQAVLEGSIQRAGERFRVTVRLMSVEQRSPLWSGKFDEELKDILAIQDSISERVTAALHLKLSSDETSRLTKRYTDNAEAYQSYIKGRYFWNKRTRDGYKKAIELFNEAIALDPAFALAYSGLADCYVLGGDASSTEEAFSKAKKAATTAIEIDDGLAEAHASLALTKMAFDWDFPAAEHEFQRAINLNPNYATAHQWYADCLLLLGREDAAIASVERARSLDPLSLVISRDAGRVFYFARRYDHAIDQCRKTLEMDPNFYPAHVTLGDAFVQKRAYADALAEYERVASLSGGRLLMRAPLVYVYSSLGKRDEAQRKLEELIELSKQRPGSAFDLAVGYIGVGDQDAAFASLEKAYQERSYRIIYMLIDPAFDSLRPHPRFQSLVSRIKSSGS